MLDDLVRSELHHSVTEVNEARNEKAVDRTFTNIKTAAVENMSLFLNDKISDQMLSNVSHKVPFMISCIRQLVQYSRICCNPHR